MLEQHPKKKRSRLFLVKNMSFPNKFHPPDPHSNHRDRNFGSLSFQETRVDPPGDLTLGKKIVQGLGVLCDSLADA